MSFEQSSETNSPTSYEGPLGPEQLRSLLEPEKAPSLIDKEFPEQQAFLEDTAGLVAVLCTRRAGKSYGAALRLLRAGYEKPGASCLYIALTRDSAKRILWKDVLKAINREKKLGATFNETTLSMTLPNGSVIYLLGADTDEEEKQKLLGQKYAAVVVDESASFSIDLTELVFGILKPAVADYRGSIALIGTPGNLKKGLFFDLTQGQDPLAPGRWTTKGWSCHRWSAASNPHMAKQWAEEIQELISTNPLIRETSLFRQHYLGQWVVDESKLVYKYQPARNDGSADTSGPGWSFVLGVDLGYSPDPSAFTLCAFHDHDRVLYVLESWKKLEMDITDVANEIKRYQGAYDISKVIIDGSAKQAVAEMQKRHGIALTPAEKTGKADFIELCNGDLIQGYVRLAPACSALKDEFSLLIWNDKSDKREEHPSCPNHCTDSFLYAWRYAYSYLATRKPKTPEKPGTAAWHEEQARRMAEEATSMREAAIEEQLEKQRAREEQNEWGF